MILNRSRQRAPNLRALDRLIAESLRFELTRIGFTGGDRLRPSTLLSFRLFVAHWSGENTASYFHQSRKRSQVRKVQQQIDRAVVEMKQRNPAWYGPNLRDRSYPGG